MSSGCLGPLRISRIKLRSLLQPSLCVLSSSSSYSRLAKGHRSHGHLDGASFNLGSKIDGLQCSQGDGNIMFIFLSVVIILTTLKKSAGHFVASVTPQLVDSWGLAGKHDILSHGYAG